MKAYRNDRTGLLEIKEVDEKTGQEIRLPGSPLFRCFEGAFGWPSLLKQEHYSKHWLLIVGRREDGVLAYFMEVSGDLNKVGMAAIDWKDRLLISRFHATAENLHSLAMLRNPEYFDGLCEYGSDGEEDGIPLWWHEQSHWKYFRDRDTYAPIVTVDSETQANIVPGQQLIRRLAEDGLAKIRPECLVFGSVIKQRPPLEDLVTHPLIRAAVWVTTAMERDIRTVEDDDEDEPWYSNPRK